MIFVWTDHSKNKIQNALDVFHRLNDDRLKILEEEKLPYLFNSSQLAEILEITASIKTRLAFIVMLGPRLIDPRAKVDHFFGLFRFSEEKEKVQEVLKARSDALNANLFRQPSLILNGNGNVESSANSTENTLKSKVVGGTVKPFMGLIARERVTKPTGKTQFSMGRQSLSEGKIGKVIDRRDTIGTMSISRSTQDLIDLKKKDDSISIKDTKLNSEPSSSSRSKQTMARTFPLLQTSFDPSEEEKDGKEAMTATHLSEISLDSMNITAATGTLANIDCNSSSGWTKQQQQQFLSTGQNIDTSAQIFSSSQLVIPSVAECVGAGKVQRMIKSFSKFSPNSSQGKENSSSTMISTDDQLSEPDSAYGDINDILKIHVEIASNVQNKEVSEYLSSHPDNYIEDIENGEMDTDSIQSWRCSKNQKSVKSLAEDYDHSNSKPRSPSKPKSPSKPVLRITVGCTENIENCNRNVNVSTKDTEIKTRPGSGQFKSPGQFNRNNNSSSISNIVDLSVYQHMAAEGPVDRNEEGIPLFRYDELVRMNFVKRYGGIKQSELIYSMVDGDFLEHFGITKVFTSLMMT